ncbi:MAG TPA: T9SS type A sorting domain-containing protein [Prolixibacteraceae bacterium]|nr:T9SS type A sorting domain-containing protein [Prolixibacteraceae bacterium]
MKKNLLITFCILLLTGISWGQIAAFEFPSTNSLVCSSNDVNIIVTDMTLSSGTISTDVVTGTYFPNEPYIGSTGGWTATNQNEAKCFTFTISANSGYVFTITNISFNAYATPAGPSAFSSEIDGTSLATIDAPDASLVNYSQSVYKTGLSAAIIKIQGWSNGSRTTTGVGDFRLDDLIILGSVSLNESASLSLSSSLALALSESNLSTSPITLTLANETFTASLQENHFNLNNTPTGTSINSVNRINDTEATINLNFDGTDFDTDITNFSITASADALSGTEPLTSNDLTITANTAPLATTNIASKTINGTATLNGTISSKGYETAVAFEYSTNPTLSSDVTSITALESPLAADANAATVSYALTGLTNGVAYYYRVIATNIEGTTQGEINQFTTIAPPTLLITEVAAPTVIANAKFVEIYNFGTIAIDLSTTIIFLARQANGGTVANIGLTGTINAGDTYVIANNVSDFFNTYGFDANIYSGNLSGNGDDGYFLYANDGHPNGIVFDAYGVLNEDGTGKSWEYTDSKAVRRTTVTAPNPIWTAGEWDITNADPRRVSPGLYPASVWNGSTNNSWNEQSNWDGETPSSNSDMIIWGGATNFPELTAATTVRNFVFTHNAQLNEQENLTVTENTTVLHQIDFSTSHASLDKWQYYTQPFTGLTAGDMLSSNERVDLYMLKYNNSLAPSIVNQNDAWEWIESAGDLVSPGRGFAVTAINDTEETGDEIKTSYYNMALSGNLIDATQNVSVPLSYLTEPADNNYNFVGNPFLAPIEWTSSSFTGNIQGNTAYVYDRTKILTEGGDKYISIQDGIATPSSYGAYIPAMQGFFVAASASGNLEINSTARVNTIKNFYKSEQTKPILRLQVWDETMMDETVIVYNEMAESKYDHYDADKMFTNGLAPQIYSILESGQKLVFNNTNTLSHDIVFQIKAPAQGTYQINLSEIGGLFNDYQITLTDYARQKTIVLSDSDYQLEELGGNKTYNFSLSFQDRTAIEEYSINNILVYPNEEQIIIKSDFDHTGTLTIYNLSGKKIVSKTVSGVYSEIDFNNNRGLFIVTVQCKNITTHHKLIMN